MANNNEKRKKNVWQKIGLGLSGFSAPFLGDTQWLQRQKQMEAEQEKAKEEFMKWKAEQHMKMAISSFSPTESNRYTPKEFSQLPSQQIAQMMPKGGWTQGQGLPVNPNIMNIPGLGAFKPSPTQQKVPKGYTMFMGKLVKLPTERDITPSTAASILADPLKISSIEKNAPGITQRLKDIVQGKSFKEETEPEEETQMDMLGQEW